MRRWLLPFLLIASAVPVFAETTETYQSPDDYLQEMFGSAPDSQTVWLIGELGNQVSEILSHKPARIRERYWSAGNRSVWILDEIGKERPITMGFMVEDDRVMDARVLVYRESRGWEIRLPRFTRQFTGAGLNSDRTLDRSIDGITGATLSVRAMQKLARVALLLHSEVQKENTLASARADDAP